MTHQVIQQPDDPNEEPGNACATWFDWFEPQACCYSVLADGGLLLVPIFLGAEMASGATAAASPSSPESADQWLGAAEGSNYSANNPGEHLLTSASAAQVTQTWQVTENGIGTQTVPVVSGGVVYYATGRTTVQGTSTVIAASVTSGQTLWTTVLPSGEMPTEEALSGNDLLVAFDGGSEPGGVTAINTTSQLVLWTAHLGPSSQPWLSNADASHLVVIDGGVFVHSSGGSSDAFSVKSGKSLWHLPNGEVQVARGGIAYGRVSADGIDSTVGIEAFDPVTQVVSWTADEIGNAYLAGTHLIVDSGSQIFAYPAAGCGAQVCHPQWTLDLPDSYNDDWASFVGGANNNALFVTWASAWDQGHLDKVDSSTGVIVGSTDLSGPASSPIRGGNVVWLLSYGGLFAFSANGRNALMPLIELAAGNNSVDVDVLAVANGTVLNQTWPNQLIAYRLPTP